MRGSSSELLLDASSQSQSNPYNYERQEQAELRRRKLLELGFGASRRRPLRRTCRQRFNFYATSALALVATSGGAALLFLVPLYVDPAISTLAADFSSEPVICTTVRRDDIVVGPGEVEAILKVNIKGCGYPPMVDCENFTRDLGYEGAKFPCHYSRVNGSIVMANYNREAQVETIMHFFAAPFVVTLATSVALCVMHCDCRCVAPSSHHSRGMRRIRINNLSDHSISNRVERRGHAEVHCECSEVTRPL
ncbi:hypothetical protein PV326_002376 [Microctonus aethiopoides]|uniref:Protein tipE n=1 Tax=Microctonus aethiopoides TaxID=144406 RepID=A0AA39KQP8_9HYME|nr:hypothetical protein PV326_002376 [Microctonus aethiopoides]KAK0170217.1 hypothetical protein PV328_010804 [Microctonus aethiopoides]